MTTSTFNPSADTYMYQAVPTGAYGGVDPLVQSYSVGNERSCIFKFDLSSIPAVNKVSSVELKYLVSLAAGSGATLTVYRVLRDWVEAQVSWNIWKTANNWTTAGCKGSGTDRAASNSGTASMRTTNGWQVIDHASLVPDVQAWVDGSLANYGWILVTSGGTSPTHQLYSKENGTPANRPVLTVVHTAPVSGKSQVSSMLGIHI